MNNQKKLYRVELSGVYFVLASSESEAESYADDYVRDSYDLVEHVSELSPTSTAYQLSDCGWEDDSLVYGAVGDVTFGEVKRRLLAGEPLVETSET